MKWTAAVCVALLAAGTSDAMKCKKLVHTCKNGVTKVYPNPKNDCKFNLCPEDMEEDDAEEATAPPTDAPVVVVDQNDMAPQWKALDEASVPTMMRDAAKLAFDLYTDKRVCEDLEIKYTSVERKNASDFIGTKNKSAKYNKVPTQSYHIVATLDCKVGGKAQVPGKFLLNMEHHGRNSVDRYQLVECGHEEQWGVIVNWLTIRDGRAYCQTPMGKAAFDQQPLHFVNAPAVAPSDSILNTIKKDKKYIAITGALVGLLGVVLIALIFAVVQARGQKKPTKWTKQNTPTKPRADDATVLNEVNSTKGLVEGVSTKNSLDEIKI
ncbi:Aste57867_13978 [Aphanomyces stellatus]|uniref:Aste57867_13978 protein n=1 Tax=Aphanomyces stellatus TaxID=120398 RepID=A0A485L168_9STRA|nr:hypothetical protein As57867_013927 [Aphanomyces stellatus]VFT90808.1 Aste57867_13978 [Aphanomyces stellatus]